MPSGRVHSAATVVLAVSGAWITYPSGAPAAQVVALTSGILTGLVLTPDLDVDQGSYSAHVVRRAFGRRAAQLWILFWLPYSLLIPHRSHISHMPILGTLLRLAYVAAIPLLAYWLAGMPFDLPPLPAAWPWAAAGLALADIAHFLLDSIF